MSKQQSISTAKAMGLLNKLLSHQWFFLVLFLLGISLRIILLIQNRPLFIDEGALATEIIENTWAGFFAPLNYQFSPPFFSILQKMSTLLFGAKEWVLRLMPLFAGVASLFIFNKWLRKSLPINVVWFPLVMMIMGWEFVKYSVEAKQYTTDVMATLLLIYAAIYYPWQNSRSRSLGWAILGSTILWLSMPSVFVLASIGVYVFIPHWQEKKYKPFFGFVGVVLCWLLSFALYFKLILAQDIGHSSLQDFHAQYFFPIFPTSLADLERAIDLLVAFNRTVMGGTFLPLSVGSVLLFCGWLQHWRESKREFMLLLLPILLAIFASGIGKYSLIPRLTLFFIPMLLFWMGKGVSLIYSRKSRALNWVFIPLLLICVFSQKSWRYFTNYYEVENMPALMSYVQQERTPTDKIYVYHGGLTSFHFYQYNADRKEEYALTNFTLGRYDHSPAKISQQFSNEKIWLLCSHMNETELNNWKNEFQKNRTLISIEKSKAGAALLFSATH